MLGSSILDVAIGMAFIYLLLSLIASAVLEALAALVQSRAANLEHGIRSLFSGGKIEGQYLVDLIYRHGLIRSLYQDPKYDKPDINDPDAAADAAKAAKPESLPILDMLRKLLGFLPARQTPERRTRPRLELLRRILGVKPSELSGDISDPFLLPAYIPARTFAVTLIDILNPDKKSGFALLTDMETRLTPLARPANGGKPDKAAEAILALLIDAGRAKGSADKFRASLENWYSDGMDRVSGWYKKHTQQILVFIGLFLAVFFNVDSINVGRTLWFDHDARQGLVSAATSFVANNPKADKENTDAKATEDAAAATSKAAQARRTGDSSSATCPPNGQPTTCAAATPGPADTPGKPASVAPAPPTGPTQKELTEKMETTVKAFNEVSTKYLLPVGWKYSLDDYWFIVTHPTSQWHAIHILEQVAGWIITALALSLGAPFWFDTLNRFMVVRSTVKPQEKSLNEVSKS